MVRALPSRARSATPRRSLTELDERLLRVERRAAPTRTACRLRQSDAQPPAAVAEEPDYFAFESRMRGSSELIRERQAAYADEFRDAAPVLDIGCGRGEFLSLLREAGVEARGIDADPDMVAHCRDEGLDVELAEALGYLSGLDDALARRDLLRPRARAPRPGALFRLLELAASQASARRALRGRDAEPAQPRRSRQLLGRPFAQQAAAPVDALVPRAAGRLSRRDAALHVRALRRRAAPARSAARRAGLRRGAAAARCGRQPPERRRVRAAGLRRALRAREDRRLRAAGPVRSRRHRDTRREPRERASPTRPRRRARDDSVQVVSACARPHPGAALAADRSRGGRRPSDRPGDRDEVPLLRNSPPEQGRLARAPVPPGLRARRHARSASSGPTRSTAPLAARSIGSTRSRSARRGSCSRSRRTSPTGSVRPTASKQRCCGRRRRSSTTAARNTAISSSRSAASIARSGSTFSLRGRRPPTRSSRPSSRERGPTASRLEGLARELRLDDRLRFAGRVDADELARLYARASPSSTRPSTRISASSHTRRSSRRSRW